MTSTKLTLPYPISANRYWASHVPRGWKRAVTYVTPEAKEYRAEVKSIARKAGYIRPTEKPIEIGTILLIPRSGVVMNLDNCLKITFDALNGVIYVDDKQIKRIRGPIEYGEPDGRGALIVEIVGTFVPSPPPIFAALEKAEAWP